MNRKNLPLIMMLIAGAVMCVVSYVQKFSILAKLVSLFVVFVVFYLLGNVLVWTLNYFDRQNEERLREEGEVIEKDGESAEEDPRDEKEPSGKRESSGQKESSEQKQHN